MKVKDTLKALSGKWNKGLSGWIFQGMATTARTCSRNTVTCSWSPLNTGQASLMFYFFASGSKREQVLRVLRGDPTNQVQEGESGAERAAKSKKSADDDFINDDDSD